MSWWYRESQSVLNEGFIRENNYHDRQNKSPQSWVQSLPLIETWAFQNEEVCVIFYIMDSRPVAEQNFCQIRDLNLGLACPRSVLYLPHFKVWDTLPFSPESPGTNKKHTAHFNSLLFLWKRSKGFVSATVEQFF